MNREAGRGRRESRTAASSVLALYIPSIVVTCNKPYRQQNLHHRWPKKRRKLFSLFPVLIHVFSRRICHNTCSPLGNIILSSDLVSEAYPHKIALCYNITRVHLTSYHMSLKPDLHCFLLHPATTVMACFASCHMTEKRCFIVVERTCCLVVAACVTADVCAPQPALPAAVSCALAHHSSVNANIAFVPSYSLNRLMPTGAASLGSRNTVEPTRPSLPLRSIAASRSLHVFSPCAESLPVMASSPKPKSLTDRIDASVTLVAAGAEAMLQDVARDPEYYIDAVGVMTGITIFCVVFLAIINAIDNMPCGAVVLKVIGLSYSLWFMLKVLAPSPVASAARDDFLSNVDDFVRELRGSRRH
jgi:CAAD domains of cyanobacterial aminoacyl-tRNA synthetase